jgi:hypothetical protein
MVDRGRNTTDPYEVKTIVLELKKSETCLMQNLMKSIVIFLLSYGFDLYNILRNNLTKYFTLYSLFLH